MFWLEHHKRANHVEFGRAQLGVGFLVVDISDDSGHAGRKLGHGRLPAIEHRDYLRAALPKLEIKRDNFAPNGELLLQQLQAPPKKSKLLSTVPRWEE